MAHDTPNSPNATSVHPGPVALKEASTVAAALGERPPETAGPLITDAHVRLAEKSLENLARVRRLALRVTDENDWTDVGGRPYLNSSGAMKVAALFGLSLTDTRVAELHQEFQGNKVVRYVARTTARFLGRELEIEGVASSDEQFFSKRDGRRLPLSEVNLNAVRKKAVTNAQNRAVKGILGLGGLTWAEVRSAGVKTGGVSSVAYAGRKSPAQKPSGKAFLKKVRVDLAAADGVSVERALREYSEVVGKDGKPRWARSVDEMSEAWVRKALEKAERVWLVLPGNGPRGGERKVASRSA